MIEIKRCECGKVNYKHGWTKQHPGMFGVVIPDTISRKPIMLKNRNGDTIRLKYSLCPVCERKASGYYEGTFQLRNTGNRLFDEVVQHVISAIDSRDDIFASKVSELKNGLDIYLSSKKFLRAVAKDIQSRYGGELKISRKLFSKSHETGREIYRVTVLLRLPNFAIGDVIIAKGRIVSVKNITGTRITGTDLENCKNVNMPYMEPDKIISGTFEVQVIQQKPFIAVLDPETFQKTRIDNPCLVTKPTIRVIKLGRRLLAVK